MRIIGILAGASAETGKRFLVIGGYAVNAHGYARLTADLDLLVQREDAPFWKALLLANGYTVFQEQSNFIQFKAEETNAIPVDFMLVNEQTFSKMHEGVLDGRIDSVAVKHPSLWHLVALKLHVLKQELPHRTLRDFNDVLELLRINRVDTQAEDFKRFCIKYGNLKLYETIVRGTR